MGQLRALKVYWLINLIQLHGRGFGRFCDDGKFSAQRKKKMLHIIAHKVQNIYIKPILHEIYFSQKICICIKVKNENMYTLNKPLKCKN